MASSPPPLALSEERRARLAACLAAVDADNAAFAAAAGGGDAPSAGATAAGWTREADPCAGVTLHSVAMPGTSLRKYRAHGALPGAPRAAAHLLWDPAARSAWDHSYAAIDSLGRVASDGDAAGVGAGSLEDEIVLQRMCVKAVLVVSQRDFVCCHLRRDRARDGSVLAVSYAAGEQDGLTPPHPDWVRGEVLEGSGWELLPAAGPGGAAHSTMTYTIFIDLHGWVPHWLVNAAISWTAKAYFEGMRQKLLAEGAGAS